MPIPATTTCPECRRDLRVPDNLLGTLVRCPHCRTEFTAGEGSLETVPPAESTPEKSTPVTEPPPTPEPPPSDAFRAAETESPADAPVYGPIPLPPRPDLDDDDDDDLEERFEESRRRRNEQESYENAKRRVLPPAICLIVVGGIALIIDAFRIIMLVVQAINGAFAAAGAGPFGGPEMMIGIAMGSISASILWASMVLYAGIKLKQLRSYGMVMAGCIIAMLPCFDGCCILGLPFAIWSLVLIHDDQIRRHFG